MKKFLAILMMALALAPIFAQGGGEKADDGDVVQLEWWTWDPLLEDMNNEIIARFEAENPGIKVTQKMVDTKDYWTKIRIQATQNKLPDVMTMSSGYLEEWSKQGLLYNLDEFVYNDDTFEIFYKSVLDSAKGISGTDHYYAIPFAQVCSVMFYNRDMFDAAGIPYPTSDWTWDDFRAAAKALTLDKDGDGKTDQWGFWHLGRYAHVEPFVFANGGNYVNKDTMRFEPDENAIEALTFLSDLTLKDKVSPLPKDMSALKQEDVFPNQLCAMWVDGSWQVDTFRRTVDFNWGICKVPSGPHGTNAVAYAWPDSYAIAANTKHPEEAWKFARYVAGEGISLDFYMAGKIPSCKALLNDPKFVDLDKLPGAEMEILKDIASGEMVSSYTMGWGEWRGYGGAESLGFQGAYNAYLNGEMTFDEAITYIRNQADKVLARYYK